MGDVIPMMDVRTSRRALSGGGIARGGRAPRATFFFDLASPWTYLAAERAERLLPGVRWRPASGDALAAGGAATDPGADSVRAAAERRAAELRLPLVWPEGWPGGAGGAMRVAALAAEQGRAGAYVLAASRLAFCGGYTLDDPEILAEAAAAAGLALSEALAAAGEVRRDGAMERTARRLLRDGADELPAVVVGRYLFAGEARLAAAGAAAAAAATPVPRRVGVRSR